MELGELDRCGLKLIMHFRHEKVLVSFAEAKLCGSFFLAGIRGHGQKMRDGLYGILRTET